MPFLIVMRSANASSLNAQNYLTQDNFHLHLKPKNMKSQTKGQVAQNTGVAGKIVQALCNVILTKIYPGRPQETPLGAGGIRWNDRFQDNRFALWAETSNRRT